MAAPKLAEAEPGAEAVVEQFWFTWTKRGVFGNTGMGLCAASLGLRNAALSDWIESVADYRLPSRLDQYSPTVVRDAPATLALLDTELGRVLVHKRYLDRDPEHRPGNWFAHGLVGAPAALPARKAIGLWQSGFWRVSSLSDTESGGDELPVVAADALQPGPLDLSW